MPLFEKLSLAMRGNTNAAGKHLMGAAGGITSGAKSIASSVKTLAKATPSFKSVANKSGLSNAFARTIIKAGGAAGSLAGGAYVGGKVLVKATQATIKQPTKRNMKAVLPFSAFGAKQGAKVGSLVGKVVVAKKLDKAGFRATRKGIKVL